MNELYRYPTKHVISSRQISLRARALVSQQSHQPRDIYVSGKISSPRQINAFVSATNEMLFV